MNGHCAFFHTYKEGNYFILSAFDKKTCWKTVGVFLKINFDSWPVA